MSDEPRLRRTSDRHLPRLVSSRHLLRCGLVAGPLFVAVFLLAGAFKGSGDDALRHPVSSLALFRADPVSGFPIGTPPLPDYTTLGALHDGFSLPAFL